MSIDPNTMLNTTEIEATNNEFLSASHTSTDANNSEYQCVVKPPQCDENALSSHWGGFTTHWYSELFASVEVWDALKNSLLVASISVVLSIVLGSMLIFFCSRNYISR